MRYILIFAIIMIATAFGNAQGPHTRELFNNGVAAAGAGDHETALARFTEVHARIEHEGATNRFFAHTHYNLGVSHYHRRNLAEAMGHLEKALRYSNQMHPRAHYLVGLIRFELDDLAGAEKSLSRSIALSAEDAEAWYDLAYVHLAANDHSAAKKAFAKAVKLGATGFAASLNNIGVLLAIEGRYAEAMIEFEKAAAADSTGIAVANLEKCRRFVDNSTAANATTVEFRFAARRAA
jgi:tetratricopeptide (TPR) repeat protein